MRFFRLFYIVEYCNAGPYENITFKLSKPWFLKPCDCHFKETENLSAKSENEYFFLVSFKLKFFWKLFPELLVFVK